MSSFRSATVRPSRRALACALSLALFPFAAAAADGTTDARTLDRVVVIGTPTQPLTFVTDTKLPRQPGNPHRFLRVPGPRRIRQQRDLLRDIVEDILMLLRIRPTNGQCNDFGAGILDGRLDQLQRIFS